MDPRPLDRARQLDAADPLATFRVRFFRPPDAPIYLDGNSLGLLSLDAEAAVRCVLDEWKTLAIGGWLDAAPPWFTLAEELAARVARLVGAEPGEVAVANSNTVNLHQLLATLYRPPSAAGGRTKILAFADEFPTDLYAISSHLRLRGLDPADSLILFPAGPDRLLDQAALEAALDDPTVQLAVLPSVVYTTGQLLDLPALARRAQAAGVRIGYDLSHSIGVVPHTLSADGADFAFWCHYKYLNAGPGAVGGLYLHARHAALPPGLAGWWGSNRATRFDMPRALDPAGAAAGLQMGTPPILALAPLAGALDVTEAAGLTQIREKSLRLTDFLMAQIDARLARTVAIVNPRDPAQRGGHVALAHPEAARLCRALRAAGVTTDFRPPDLIRLAPVPLYTSFVDCHLAVERLAVILEERTYEQYPPDRALVP